MYEYTSKSAFDGVGGIEEDIAAALERARQQAAAMIAQQEANNAFALEKARQKAAALIAQQEAKNAVAMKQIRNQAAVLIAHQEAKNAVAMKQVRNQAAVLIARAEAKAAAIRAQARRVGAPVSGMGALGWSPNWTVPMSKEVRRSEPCSGGTMACATYAEQQFMSNQGCRTTEYQGLDACRTSDNSAGSLWCCPPGRPGTGAASTVQQIAVSRANITALQTWINQQPGCNAGTVDGRYGPNTRRGLDCAIAATSLVNIVSRFPFVNTLLATPSGEPRPTSMVFDPGTTAKTPEQAGAGTPTTGGGGGGGGGGRQETTPPEEAGILSSLFGVLPWWGWLGIAGGVGLVAVIAVAVMGGGEEEEPRRLGRPGDYKLGSIEEYAL